MFRTPRRGVGANGPTLRSPAQGPQGRTDQRGMPSSQGRVPGKGLDAPHGTRTLHRIAGSGRQAPGRLPTRRGRGRRSDVGRWASSMEVSVTGFIERSGSGFDTTRRITRTSEGPVNAERHLVESLLGRTVRPGTPRSLRDDAAVQRGLVFMEVDIVAVASVLAVLLACKICSRAAHRPPLSADARRILLLARRCSAESHRLVRPLG